MPLHDDEPLEDLLAVSPPAWRNEFEQIGAYLSEVGERVPEALRAELIALEPLAVERTHNEASAGDEGL